MINNVDSHRFDGRHAAGQRSNTQRKSLVGFDCVVAEELNAERNGSLTPANR